MHSNESFNQRKWRFINRVSGISIDCYFPHLLIDSIDTLERWLRKELRLPYAKSHMIVRPASVLSGNKIAFTPLPESWEIKF